MAEIFALDTNIYVRALRRDEFMPTLKRFLIRTGTRLRVNAVVAQELRTGARTPAQEAAVRALVAAYSERGQVTVPSFMAYLEAGRVLAALALNEGVEVSRAGSLVNDVLLATSCREDGVCLVTDNTNDFAAAQRYLRGFRFLASADVM